MMYSQYKSDSSQAMPKIFKTEKEKYGEVTVISANHNDNSILLVGFSNGSISVYRTSQASAVINLPMPDLSTRVTWLTWSFTCAPLGNDNFGVKKKLGMLFPLRISCLRSGYDFEKMVKVMNVSMKNLKR
uniref:Uncharacterized protein n=1 Tax=Caenorhabditis japonica TaxID=281687 RepID=A0A8R1EQ93_CAEJA